MRRPRALRAPAARRAAALLVVLAAVLPCAATASAGTIAYTAGRYVPPDCAGKCGAGVTIPERMAYDAAPDETNDLLVAARPDGTYDVHDAAGVAIGAGDTRCTAVDPETARCGRPFTDVALGDGDDHARDESGAAVDGGPGDDVLVATGTGPGPHVLSGGAGDDVLRGGDAAETFDDGPGTDRIEAGGGDDVVRSLDGVPSQNPGPVDPRRDTFDGGAGHDRLDAHASPIPVHVDLAGGTGADDTVTGFEAATGSPWADALHGSAGADAIEGGGGNDRIDAGGGDDDLAVTGGTVLGGDGNDRIGIALPDDLGPIADPSDVSDDTALVDAGPGDDRVVGITLNAVVRCGSGDDTAVTARGDVPGLRGDDCEHGTGRVALSRRGAARLHVVRGCLGRDVGVTRCDVRVRVRDRAGRTIASAAFRRDGDPGDLSSPDGRVRLPGALRARIRRGHRPLVRVDVERRSVALGRTSRERGTLRVRLGRRDLRALPCPGCR